MLLKIVGLKGLRNYLKPNWNRFDAVIVIASLIDLGSGGGGGLSLLRVFRLLRLVRLLRRVPPLYKVLEGCLKSVAALVRVPCVCVCCYYDTACFFQQSIH